MKELSIKGKATRYDEALERARQFSEKPYLEDSAGIVEYIFPELKESKDERIRKALIDYHKRGLKDSPWFTQELKHQDILAWLESLKNRVQPQPKQEWNKEDEKILTTPVKSKQNKVSNYGQSRENP